MALQRIRLNLSWDEAVGDEDLRELAEAIWQTCYMVPLTVEELFGQLGWVRSLSRRVRCRSTTGSSTRSRGWAGRR